MSVLKLQSILLWREIVNILRSCVHVNELTVTEENSDHTEQLYILKQRNCIFQGNTHKILMSTSKMLNMNYVVQRANKIVTDNGKNQTTFSISASTLCLYVSHR